MLAICFDVANEFQLNAMPRPFDSHKKILYFCIYGLFVICTSADRVRLISVARERLSVASHSAYIFSKNDAYALLLVYVGVLANALMVGRYLDAHILGPIRTLIAFRWCFIACCGMYLRLVVDACRTIG